MRLAHLAHAQDVWIVRIIREIVRSTIADF